MENALTFKDHYNNLKQVAEKIRSQQEPDIDTLVPLVDSGLASYAACKERLLAVKTMLGERLPPELNALE